MARRAGATIVDPVEHLCGPTTCPTLDETGRPLYRDSDHVSATAIRSEPFRVLDDLARP